MHTVTATNDVQTTPSHLTLKRSVRYPDYEAETEKDKFYKTRKLQVQVGHLLVEIL